MTGIAGRVALVTGGNRGIGLETCRQLARLRARVVLGSRESKSGAAAEAGLREEGLDVAAFQLDVSCQASIDAAAAWVEAKYGRLDILINNAAVLLSQNRVLEASLEELEATWKVNVLGAWRGTLAFLPLMQRGGWGRIVNVSSLAGSLARTNSTAAAYGISKTALNALTRLLAAELSTTGILVNSVSPGWVATDMGGPQAPRTLEQGASSVVWAVTLDDDGPTGGFFMDGRPLPW